MGRPSTHTTDDFLDAAAGLFAEGGARALTMRAVARAVGAPSGSIYHRFSDRPALLAALCLRTTRRFETSYLGAMGAQPTPASTVEATAWIVDWCRTHLSEAIVLQAGVQAFGPDEWRQSAKTELDEAMRAQRRGLAKIVKTLADQTGVPRDQVAFCLIDLPLAVVRRHLVAAEPPPPAASRLARALSTAILLQTARAEGQ